MKLFTKEKVVELRSKRCVVHDLHIIIIILEIHKPVSSTYHSIGSIAEKYRTGEAR